MKKILIIVVLIVILAIGSLLGGYYFMSTSKKELEGGIVFNKAGGTTIVDTDKTIRILVLGSDSRSHNMRGSRSDANMLIQINPDKSADIVSFPRDSYVNIPGYGSRKINSALAVGGPELTVKTVQNYSGLKIDYYMVASFPRFTGIINSFGGLKFDFDKPLHDSLAGASFGAGKKKLRGGEALAVARSRHIAGGDFTRQANQQKLAIAAYKQAKPSVHNFSSVLKLVTIVTKRVNTNLSDKELFNLGRVIFKTDPNKIFNTVLRGGTGSGGGGSVVHLDRSYANKTFSKLKKKEKR